MKRKIKNQVLCKIAEEKSEKTLTLPGEQSRVRLFLSEDAPIFSALGSQDHLQAKGSWPSHATGLDSDDSLPPGFEAPHPFYQFKIDLSQIPIIKWNIPPSVVLNPHWSVVAGEESEEASAEAHRELAVLEAIYPRQSSIPPNPSVSPEVRDSSHDDSQTPLVPITAIEDEDAFDRLETSLSVDGSNTFQQPAVHNTPEARTPSSSLPDRTRLIMEHLQQKAATSALGGEKLAVNGARLATEPDVAAAAAAAFTAIMRSNEQGSLIDQDLLIKILSDPALVQKLLAEYGANNKQQQPQVGPLSSALLPPPPPPPLPPPPHPHPHPQIHAASSATSLAIPPASHLYPVPSAMPSPAMVLPPPVNLQTSPSAAAAVIPVAVNSSSSIPLPVKDVNYYKSLILQHGGDKQEAFVSNTAQFGSYSDSSSIGKVDVDSARNVGSRQQRDGKNRIPKPCVFFNSPRGCRHGASCLYLHDTSSTVPQRSESSKGPKRMKVDRGIADRSG
ncbi:zinc finger CCCH domain-containing protein 30-like isoform X2 [Ananas comosus]|uniref:Zinc finger CCCH domain-containing protein 30-like isoform X2 n=1 Tax=Ananas comosus TaxID=4615 RepID=A0A6P5GWP6_ANACO|nr:zinc finger CCCH domain-containing protein 30-like isoform X2 [Ananas comosus]